MFPSNSLNTHIKYMAVPEILLLPTQISNTSTNHIGVILLLARPIRAHGIILLQKDSVDNYYMGLTA